MAEQQAFEQAQIYWKQAHQFSLDAGFDDEVRNLAALTQRFPALKAAIDNASSPRSEAATSPSALNKDDPAILNLARQHGRLTAVLLVEHLHVSKATATRRLMGLVEKELLAKRGKGRGTHYVLAEVSQPSIDSATPWSQRLEEAQRSLAQAYNFTALTLIAHEPQPLLCISARFQQPPALARFLQLEAELSRLPQTNVNLKLAKDTP